MARTVTARHVALVKARERRLVLDAERGERDRRVEEATAEALMLIAARSAAERAVAEASTGIGAALRRLLAEGIGIDAVAALVDLDVIEARRMTRLGRGAESDSGEARAGETGSWDRAGGGGPFGHVDTANVSVDWRVGRR